MSKSKPITAAELMKQLQADPDQQARLEQRHQIDAEAEAKYRTEVTPILNELNEFGMDVDLYNLVQEYGPLSEQAVQILLKWLMKISNNKVLEGIIRALAVTKIPYDGTPLIELFERVDNELLRWTIANTIAEAMPENIEDWLITAVNVASYGKAREMLIVALARLVKPEAAIANLIPLIDQYPGFIAMAFAECGGKEQIDLLHSKRDSVKKWEQKEIDRAISSIQKRL